MYECMHARERAEYLWTDNDIIDGNMNEFDEESNETHDAEADGCGNSNLLEFTSVRFRATLHQTQWVLGEQAAWFTEFN